MTTIPVGVVSATYIFGLAGDPEPMTVTMAHVIPPAVTVAQDVADDLYDLAILASPHTLVFNSAMANSYSFLGVRVYTNISGTLDIAEHLATVTGTRSTSCPPSNCSMIVQKSTGRLGRKYRGRFYLPPMYVIASNLSPTGVIDATDVSSMETRMDAWHSECQSAGYQMYLLHNDPTLLGTAITALTVEGTLGTQRRRMRK